jgi:hypothetical protein
MQALRLRLGLALAGCIGLVVAGFVSDNVWLVGAAKVAAVVGPVLALLLWSIQRGLATRESVVITVTPDGVRRQEAHKDVFRPEELLNFLEHERTGLVLRTAEPHRVLIVPADLDGFPSCRAEIVALGIPASPVNREWLNRARVGIVASLLSLAVLLLFDDPTIVDLGAAGLLGGAYWTLVSARRGDVGRARSSMWGALGAIAMSVTELLLRVHHVPRQYHLYYDGAVLGGFLIKWATDACFCRTTPPTT